MKFAKAGTTPTLTRHGAKGFALGRTFARVSRSLWVLRLAVAVSASTLASQRAFAQADAGPNHDADAGGMAVATTADASFGDTTPPTTTQNGTATTSGAATMTATGLPHDAGGLPLPTEQRVRSAEVGTPRTPIRAPEALIGGAWSPQPSRPMTIVGAPGRGVTFATGDDFFSLTLRGRFQVRDTLIAPTQAFSSSTPELLVSNELLIRTARLILSGYVYSRQTQYVVQLAFGQRDFEANTVSPLFDAWIALNQLRDLQVRIGQFFVPFDRGRTNAEWGLNLVDRPLVIAEATLDRDVGVELGSNDLGGLGVLAYRAGVFGGEGKNRLAASPGFLYVGRFQFNPFGAFDDSVEADPSRGARPRLALAIAGAFNHRASRAQSTQGTTLQLATVDYGHLAADATFKFRGLYLFGEVLLRQATRDQLTGLLMGMASTEYSRSVWGYVFQAGYMLTTRLELAGRWEQSFAIGATDPALITQLRAQGNEFGVGVNWYQAGHGLKIQSDYHYLFGDTFDRGRSQIRLQVQVSL